MNTTQIVTSTRRHVINSRVAIPAGTAATIIRSAGRDYFFAETAKGQVFGINANQFEVA